MYKQELFAKILNHLYHKKCLPTEINNEIVNCKPIILSFNESKDAITLSIVYNYRQMRIIFDFENRKYDVWIVNDWYNTGNCRGNKLNKEYKDWFYEQEDVVDYIKNKLRKI